MIILSSANFKKLMTSIKFMALSVDMNVKLIEKPQPGYNSRALLFCFVSKICLTVAHTFKSKLCYSSNIHLFRLTSESSFNFFLVCTSDFLQFAMQLSHTEQFVLYLVPTGYRQIVLSRIRKVFLM